MKPTILLLAAAALCAAAPERPKSLVVGAPPDVMLALEELAPEFEAATGAKLELLQGSSASIAKKVRAGETLDVFVAGDTAFPRAVAAAGLGDGLARRYARGYLIVWSLTGADVSGLAALRAPGTARIAVPEPKTDPYGKAALEALNKVAVYAAIKDKLVFVDSTAEVDRMVAAGAVDAGFTARGVVETERWKGTGVWTEVDRSFYAPLDRAFIVTKAGAKRNARLAREFKQLLLGPRGRQALLKYGFDVPKPRD